MRSRCIVFGIGLGVVFALMPTWGIAHGADTSAHPDPARIRTLLQEGNRRFVSGHPRHPHSSRSRVRETGLYGQHPQAVILSCADSRVCPEILFDQGLGDLFTIRVAGNVANEDEIASVEYAADPQKRMFTWYDGTLHVARSSSVSPT